MSESESVRRITLHQTCDENGKKLFRDNYISTTKYSWWNFIPKHLFEQFSRIANFYFLLIACFQMFPWSPLESGAAFLPLAFVILLSMFREGVEDFLRWRADSKVNSSLTKHANSGLWEELKWRHILVGDVILIRKDEQIPADVVLLNTSEAEGVAYIDTCNLDGETNLKLRQSLPQTRVVTDAATASQFHADICCDEPNNLLYSFNGYLQINDVKTSLDNKQVMLRGCVLRNTQWVIGAVVYTGIDTKLMMNSTSVRSKKSSLERGLNRKLVSVLVFLTILGFVGGVIGVSYEDTRIKSGKAWYFYRSDVGQDLFSRFFILMISYWLLMSSIVPISLYVTLEFVRVFQGLHVNWDADMYNPEDSTAADARTSNLSDDLGLVEYIFSDKTGTLTRNVMEFMKCSIAGCKYGEGITEVAYASAMRRGIQCPKPDRTGKAFKSQDFTQMLENPTPEIKHFLWMLSTCHSVVTELDAKRPHGVIFQASSPDEGALVEAAADFGYVFSGRGHDFLRVKVNGHDTRVEVLAILEFSSERKRSSVIIKSPETGQITLYCKGADDCIMQRLADDETYAPITHQHLKDFAADGLRTLCAAYREIDADYFSEWLIRYNTANCALEGRDELVEAIADEIERDLHLIGATAIEDKLQIGVPETIEDLLKAGIKVWVITGDKRETAINIGYACSLLSSDMSLLVLDSENSEEIGNAICHANPRPDTAVVISGSALNTALSESFRNKFIELTSKCKSVICCRVSPYQKGQIVELVRDKTKKVTLAIGDGANDVGMILKADIGVGISGQEGRQAVMNSDYSFAQFRFLKKLLLFHGRLNFVRNINLVNYSFYKNIVFTLNQFYFGFFCRFSATTLFDGYMLAIYNLFFTSLPIMAYAIFEKDVSSASHSRWPELYRLEGRKQWLLSEQNFWISLMIGLIHSLIVFFIPYYGMKPYVGFDGYSVGLAGLGQTIYACAVLVVTSYLGVTTMYWTWLLGLFIIISIVLFPILSVAIDVTGLGTSIVGQSAYIMGTWEFWASLLATVTIAIIPAVGNQAVLNSMNHLTNKIMMVEHKKAMAKLLRRDRGSELSTIESHHDDTAHQYVDEANETGYQFSPPVSMYEASTFAQQRSRRNPSSS